MNNRSQILKTNSVCLGRHILAKLSEQKDEDAKEIKRLNGYLEYTKAIFQIEDIEELGNFVPNM